MGTRITMAQFAAKHRISMRVEWEASRPDKLMGDSARHFRCTLRCLETSKRIVVHFSQGSAHVNEPTVEDVLNCMASDSSGWENSRGDFNEWAREYGYSLDDRDATRKARKVFDAVERQTLALGRLIGTAYEELLYKTEGL